MTYYYKNKRGTLYGIGPWPQYDALNYVYITREEYYAAMAEINKEEDKYGDNQKDLFSLQWQEI